MPALLRSSSAVCRPQTQDSQVDRHHCSHRIAWLRGRRLLPQHAARDDCPNPPCTHTLCLHQRLTTAAGPQPSWAARKNVAAAGESVRTC
jgi:hypothetical protein